MSKHAFLKLLATSLPCLMGAVAYADGAVNEVEPNDPFDAAQRLSVAEQITVHGFLGVDDVDYYTVYATAGHVLSFDVDNAYGGSGTEDVDTIMAVFGPSPAYDELRYNDDSSSLDPGSSTILDSRIDNFVAPSTGYYTVGVTSFGHDFTVTDQGVTLAGSSSSEGDYDLVISGVSSFPDLVTKIAIEVKPGDDDIAPINPRSHGKIPVAILGGPNFNVYSIDKKSITFGSTGYEDSLARCDWTGTDVNGDGFVDIICHFYTDAASFKPTDAEATLRGRTHSASSTGASTTSGDRGADKQFQGTGFLKVVPAKAQF